MAGGAWEYIMGIMLDSAGNPISGRNSTYYSGFKGSYGEGGSNTTGYDWAESKYYDTYAYSTSDQAFGRRILGDATGEIGPFESVNYGSQIRSISSWYKDFARSITPASPWFIRGYDYYVGTDAGVFTSISSTGGTDSHGSFRVVLMP